MNKMNSNTNLARNNKVRSYIENGMILSSKYSTFKLKSTTTSFELFSGQESRESPSYSEKLFYNTQGKNPLDAQEGKILGFSLDVFADDFEPVNWAGPSNDYAVLKNFSRFLNQLLIEVRVNKELVREFMGIEVCKPLPQVLFHTIAGVGVTPANITVAAVMPHQGTIESDRNVIRLPIEVKNNDSLQIACKLLSGDAGASLATHLVVGRLFTLEKPSTNK